MQRCYSDRVRDTIHHLDQEPLHYLKNNMSFTFEEDYIGAKMIPDPEFLIRDSVIWGCDYPHEQGQTWPDATPAMKRMFTGVDPDPRARGRLGAVAAYLPHPGTERIERGLGRLAENRHKKEVLLGDERNRQMAAVLRYGPYVFLLQFRRLPRHRDAADRHGAGRPGDNRSATTPTGGRRGAWSRWATAATRRCG